MEVKIRNYVEFVCKLGNLFMILSQLTMKTSRKSWRKQLYNNNNISFLFM